MPNPHSPTNQDAALREVCGRLFSPEPGRKASPAPRPASADSDSEARARDRVGERIALAWIESPLGPLVAGATSRGLCLLEFADRPALEAQGRALSARLGGSAAPGPSPHLEALASQLAEYFAGKRRNFELALDEPGTPFQERVWAELGRIPYGETRSYAQVAAALGEPKAFRAVARANGMNRLAIVVPCHRVINADGGLGGYGGGLSRKLRLLELEGALPAGAGKDAPRHRGRPGTRQPGLFE